MRNSNELFTEAHRILDTARMLNDDANRNGVDFIHTELDLSMTLAKRAFASFSTGYPDKAKESALSAEAAYWAARKFLPRLEVKGQDRELIAGKLGKLTPLIEKLSEIR